MRAHTNLAFVVLFTLISALLCAQMTQFFTVKLNSPPNHYGDVAFKQLGPDDQNLFLFVQITDLHISKFRDHERYEQLKEFCMTDLHVIKPRLVIVSGDLTDAIAADKIVAKQYEEEWKMYHGLYESCLTNTSILHWLDMRGNHDNFNVDRYNSSTNFYPKYGAQRTRMPGSYMTIVRESNITSYAFVAVDATLDIGPKRILNFMGDLDMKKLQELENFQEAIESARVNASFWFGHYPTSSILAANSLRLLAAKSVAYFCGHLHTWGGLVPKMYSSHHSGMLELELADWKDKRMYRIAAMDHGLFTFADIKHGVWPAVVVLNPKPLITVQPAKEPFHLSRNSTHIRLLVYSPSEITSCEVKIDNGPWQSCQLTGESNPLYTAPWNPDNYANGLHTLEVRAKDKSGSVGGTSMEFALDETSPNFPLSGKFALMTNLTTMGKVLFTLIWMLLIIPFWYFRFMQDRILQRKASPRRGSGSYTRGLWIIANVNSFFYPLLFYTLYLVFGPWYAGDLVDGKVGVVFIWGTFFADDFLPGALTYYYGVFHLLTFNLPLVTFLAKICNLRFKEEIVGRSNTSQVTWWRKLWKLTPFLCFLVIQISITYIFYVSYGWLAVLLNPFRSWALVLAIYLRWRANNLTRKDLEEISKVWT